MRKMSLLLILLAICSMANAQDQMVLKSGSTVKVKILSSDARTVNYQIPAVYGDSVLTKDKKEIVALVFESGYTELTGQDGARKNSSIEHETNKISFDAFGFLGKEVYLQYERLLSNGAIAIRVPLGINYHFSPEVFNYFIFRNRYFTDYSYSEGSGNSYVYLQEKKGMAVHSGASIVVFFNGQKKVRGYLAPGIVTGLVHRKYESFRTVYNDYGYSSTYSLGDASRTSLLLGTDVKLGFSVMTASKVSIALETGGGYGTLINKGVENSRMGMWRLSVLVGYSFRDRKRG